MSKEDKLTAQVRELREAVKEFVARAPSFEGERLIAGRIGMAFANVETTLHWQFGCWELALPEHAV